MGRTRDIITRFLGEEKDLVRSQKTIQGEFEKTDKKVGVLGQNTENVRKKFQALAAGALLAVVAGVGSLIGKLDQLAQKMQSTERMAETVFGDMVEQARAWAAANNEAFGVSETALLSLISKTQDLLVPMGFTRDMAFGLSKDILTAANALSEWEGGTISATDAQLRIAKAMLGEREGLVELGVKLSDAEVKARLAEKGLKGLTGEALAQATALVTLEAIQDKSTDALTAYEDRAGSATAAQKELDASTADSAQTWANMFKPAMDAAKTGLIQIVNWGRNATNVVGAIFGNDEAKEALRFKEALDSIRAGLKAGLQPSAAYAEALFHIAQNGDLSRGELEELAAAAGIVLEEASPEELRAFADEIAVTGKNAGFSNEAIREVVEALRLMAAAEENTAGTNSVFVEGMKSTATTAGSAADEVNRLRQEEIDLANTRKAALSPALAALNAIKANTAAQEALTEAGEEGKSTAAEITELQLEAAIAAEEAKVKIAEFGEVGYASMVAFAEATGVSFEQAANLYVQLGLLDGKTARVSIITDYFDRGGKVHDEGIPAGMDFASGGVVPGPRGKRQLAVVHGGEEVVRAQDRGRGGGAGGGVEITRLNVVNNFNNFTVNDGADSQRRNLTQTQRQLDRAAREKFN